ncbi:MAG: Ig-like domain-containing protein [Christensenellales bacterium]|jgi:uncharacterized protein YkwD
MHKLTCVFLAVMMLVAAPCARGETHTRETVRTLYAQMVRHPDASPYQEKPRVSAPYAAGMLTADALEGALAYVNFLREIAYLESELTLSSLYTLRAQYAAALLAANDKLAHDAPKPAGMADDFYQVGHAGTMSSNIACINWMDDDILMRAVEYFVRDDGEENLSALGHRRWLLNPNMAQTGFGLANSARGLSYAAMYAHDLAGAAGEWSSVLWPSRGAFPAELMSKEIAWSATLNPLAYDIEQSEIVVTMSEKAHGEAQLSYFTVNTEQYGAGPCVIFVPDLAGMGIEEYQQNQIWRVTIAGLKSARGEKVAITYEVEMIALSPIDPAAVEIEPGAVALSSGEAALLTARVIPAWADDLTVVWESADETVAKVDGAGRVTAVAPGTCEIRAVAANGRFDACQVTVFGDTQQDAP